MKKKVLISLAAIVVILILFVLYAGRTSRTVVAEHTFAAPVEKVFALWRDPEVIKKWWGPKDYTSPLVRSDLREGGEFLLCMQSPGGDVFCNSGRYVEVAENARIVSTLAFADQNGRVLKRSEIPVPGKWPDEISVRAEFESDGVGARLRITEEGIPMIMSLFARMGWDQQFDKMETLLKEMP